MQASIFWEKRQSGLLSLLMFGFAHYLHFKGFYLIYFGLLSIQRVVAMFF
jgi:hypothetical protein